MVGMAGEGVRGSSTSRPGQLHEPRRAPALQNQFEVLKEEIDAEPEPAARTGITLLDFMHKGKNKEIKSMDDTKRKKKNRKGKPEKTEMNLMGKPENIEKEKFIGLDVVTSKSSEVSAVDAEAVKMDCNQDEQEEIPEVPVAHETARRRSTRTARGKRRFAPFTVEDECKEGCCKDLRILETIQPADGLGAVTEGGWEEVELAVDSGASETVIGEHMVQSAELRDGIASKRGVEYEVANGVRIPNLGEKRFVGTTDEGISRSLTAQVCSVNKALLSVSRLIQNGNRVVFDSEGSYVEDKGTGEVMGLQEKHGMFMLRLWTQGRGF